MGDTMNPGILYIKGLTNKWILPKVYHRVYNYESPIVQEAERFMEKIEPEPKHVQQVTLISQLLFREMQPWHHLTEHESYLLTAASLLHDIGWVRSPSGLGHHRHSGQMIREFSWESLSEEEVVWVSLIARYHTKNIPVADDDTYFEKLPESAQRLVTINSALIRIADALDHSHRAIVKELSIEKAGAEYVCRVEASGHLSSEVKKCAQRSDLFEKTFDHPFRLENS
ncbi:MAG: HD domain-containing protein [Verrucomicrobiota bacterium]